ncbi:MAG: hypothetical protein VW683_02545 [Betaproteobacteria bacterium]
MIPAMNKYAVFGATAIDYYRLNADGVFADGDLRRAFKATVNLYLIKSSKVSFPYSLQQSL